MPFFQICTFVTNHAQYAEMKSSFVAAGFDEERCIYTVFDNSKVNSWDPFSTITQTLQQVDKQPVSDRPNYVIFCHQDIVLDQSHGFDQLTNVLGSLDASDSKWAIAGNAGVTESLQPVRHISDSYAVSFRSDLPVRVLTLDENILVVRPRTGLRCSEGLSGWVLYGTDLCLHAFERGLSVYVVDFKLRHTGRLVTADSGMITLEKLRQVWNPRFPGAYVGTTYLTFCFSRFGAVCRLLQRGRPTNFALAHPGLAGLLLKVNRPFVRMRR